MAEDAKQSVKNVTRGVLTTFNRARQLTEEKLGHSEKTDFDQNFENLSARADRSKLWTEKIVKEAEHVLRPSAGSNEKIEDFVRGKLGRGLPTRLVPVEVLGQQMTSAGHEYGPIPLGHALLKCGETECALGIAEKEFVGTGVNRFVIPMKKFLDEEIRSLQRERSVLNRKRLDLDSAKARQKRAKTTDRMQAADAEVRQCQNDFDRQYELTKLMLEGLSKSRVSQVRNLQDFIEAQETYHRTCAEQLQELQQDLRRSFSAMNATAPPPEEAFSSAASDFASPTASAASTPSSDMTTTQTFSSAPVHRRAKVTYDYDAANEQELSLLADEVIVVYSSPGLDSGYMMAERGAEKGRVPVAYIELL
ncbi:endophilin-B1-like [Sycon ciliatum]|uniref:endophilin-B1-like n=1 Tax=Sycon ciliatum TaxID=27933 RepID=UPI0020A95670|eukprot:scpid80455/ scgid29099/ Endophilin-B1; SH3 domain-containing GRB2-like protein B1